MEEKKLKLCFIGNLAAYYHFGLYKEIERVFDSEFVFGHIPNKNTQNPIKEMDYKSFSSKFFDGKCYVYKDHFLWQTKIIGRLFDKYDNYIITDEIYNSAYWFFLILGKFFPHKKIYLYGHCWYGRETLIKVIIKKIFFWLSDGVFSYGNRARELMIAHGISASKIATVGNCLNYDLQLRYRGNMISNIYLKHFGNDFPVLIFIGRLIETKRLDLIISAMSILEDKYDLKTNCAYVGEGTAKQKLLELAAANNISDRVWLYGASYNEEEISTLIMNADLCVSPGNIGLTAMHSLAYGTPLITGDKLNNQGPEFESIRSGETGYLYKQNDVEDLARVIYKWLSTKNDRNKVRENCYKEIERQWTPQHNVEVFYSVLNNNYKR